MATASAESFHWLVRTAFLPPSDSDQESEAQGPSSRCELEVISNL